MQHVTVNLFSKHRKKQVIHAISLIGEVEINIRERAPVT